MKHQQGAITLAVVGIIALATVISYPIQKLMDVIFTPKSKIICDKPKDTTTKGDNKDETPLTHQQ